MFTDIIDILSAFGARDKDLVPQLVAIAISIYTLIHINKANSNIKLLFTIIDDLKTQVSDMDKDLEILHDDVYKHYLLTHREARKYLHYHSGCKTTNI